MTLHRHQHSAETRKQKRKMSLDVDKQQSMTHSSDKHFDICTYITDYSIRNISPLTLNQQREQTMAKKGASQTDRQTSKRAAVSQSWELLQCRESCLPPLRKTTIFQTNCLHYHLKWPAMLGYWTTRKAVERRTLNKLLHYEQPGPPSPPPKQRLLQKVETIAPSQAVLQKILPTMSHRIVQLPPLCVI